MELYRKINQTFIIPTEEEILFSDGELEVIDDGMNRSWQVVLANVKNGKTFKKALRSKQHLDLKIITEYNEEFFGNVMIMRISSDNLGAYIELKGNGQLKGNN